jgi:hypothetical protein
MSQRHCVIMPISIPELKKKNNLKTDKHYFVVSWAGEWTQDLFIFSFISCHFTTELQLLPKMITEEAEKLAKLIFSLCFLLHCCPQLPPLINETDCESAIFWAIVTALLCQQTFLDKGPTNINIFTFIRDCALVIWFAMPRLLTTPSRLKFQS